VEDVDLQIIVPATSDEPLCDMLVAITKAIDERDSDLVAHGCLGGEHGYGGHWDSPVFTMRPFYWGDCDCGYEERSESWHAANPHAPDCWRSERDRRWAAYDAKVGWEAIERATFGDDRGFFSVFDAQTERNGPLTVTMFKPRADSAMEAWRKAHDRREAAHARIVVKLYDEFGLPRSRYQWHCSCGVDERAKAYFETEGHYATCALELPNFRHHASGMEVRWYKYIGRDMEAKNAPADLSAIFAECLADIAQSDSD